MDNPAEKEKTVETLKATSTSYSYQGQYKTSSSKAGIYFPVARLQRKLKHDMRVPSVRAGAAVYLGAVLEYLVSEVVDASGSLCKTNKRVRIVPRDIQIAVQNDHELQELCKDVTIIKGGVLPNIEPILLAKKSSRSKRSTDNVHIFLDKPE